MTKELLIEILNKKLFLELALIIFVYSILWLVNLKLSFQILGIKVSIRKLLPGILIGIIYSLFGKQIFSNLTFGLIIIVLLIILIKTIGKVPLIKAFWVAFLIVLITGIGVITIQTSLCSINKNIAFFILQTPYGVIIGSLMELLFPIIIFFILSTYQISLLPKFGRNLAFLDCLGVFLFGDIFFIIYSTSTRVLINFNDNSKQVLIMNVIYEWIAAIAGGIVFYIIHITSKKQREHEQRKYEGQILRLIEENQELNDINNQLKAQNLEPQEVVEVIDGIINKLQNVSNSINIQAKNNGHSESFELIDISPREVNIIKLIAQGKSNKEIAASVYLSEGRIKNIITKLLEKLGLADRTQLAVYAVQNKLVYKE